MHDKVISTIEAPRSRIPRATLPGSAAYLVASTLAGLAALSPSTGYAQSFQPLGFAPGGDSEATAVSADRPAVVGCSGSACGSTSQAVRWKADGSSEGLGHLAGYTDSAAGAVSA